MAAIHPEARVAYLAHPRTASVATEEALLSRPGWRRSEGAQDRHAAADRIPEIGDPGRWTLLTTVRNHWDAMVSFAHWKVFDMAFGTEYIEALVATTREYIRPPRLWWRHLPRADHVLRYERLEADLAAALASVGLAVPDRIPRANVSAGRDDPDHRPFYDAEAREAIRSLFGPEIEELGYTY